VMLTLLAAYSRDLKREGGGLSVHALVRFWLDEGD